MAKDGWAKLIPEFLLNSETYSLVLTDLEGRYIHVNEVFKKRFALKDVDFLGQPFAVAIYPEDVERFNLATYECMTNPTKTVSIQIRKPDNLQGDFYWTNWECSLFKDSNQQPIGILCLGHDIAETEKSSRQAKEFAQKVETIIEEITDGFYVLNRAWEFVKINKVAEQILGIGREKLVGRRFWDLFPDTPEFNYPGAYRKAMNEYLTITFEDYRADLGLWFSTVCYPSKEGLTIFFKDISQEKKTLEMLKDSENKLRAILDGTTDGNILISPDYKILCFNKQANETVELVTGMELQEMSSIWEYIFPEDKELFYKYTQKALSGKAQTFEKKIFLNEFSVWYRVTYYPAYDSEEEILGFNFNTTNISDLKQKEIRLQENKNRLDRTLESIPHPFLVVNEQRNITYVNNEFERVFGYTGQEVLDKPIDFLIPERYRNVHKEHEEHYLGTGGVLLHKFSGNITAITKTKQEIAISASLNTFTVGGEKFVFVILEDITELKKRQAIILKQNEALRQIAWQQSHEVRRPLANILGLYELLSIDEKATAEEKQLYLDYILQMTKELDTIIHKISSITNTDDRLNA